LTHFTTEGGFDSRKKRAEELVGSLEAIEKRQRLQIAHQVKQEGLKQECNKHQLSDTSNEDTTSQL